MPEEAVRLHTLFPCGPAEAHLAAIPPASGPPRTAWTRRYRVLTIGGGGLAAAGTVTLSRQPRQEGLFLLELVYEKRLTGKTVSRTHASMQCREDPLATPSSWEMKVDSYDAHKRMVPAVAYTHKGTVAGDSASIRAFGRTRRLPVSARTTINWALFEAVGRLPHSDFSAITFTLLDDFDQVKPGLRLGFAGIETVVMGGRQEVREHVVSLEQGRVFRPKRVWVGGIATDLARYHLTGPGIVPWVFRVDPFGRMLFAAAGTEAYTLEYDGPPAPDAHRGATP